MALGFSASVADSILNALGNATNWTAPTAFWIQLPTADPGAAGTTLVAGNATREQVSFGAPGAGAAGTRLISNDTAVSWTSGEVDTSEDYTHWSGWDASTAGNFLCSGTMTANAVTVGDQFTIPIGDLDLTVSEAE
jgi:hypothetical protein